MPLLTAALIVAPLPVTAPACAARELRLTTNGADGDFDGMSHSGTYLVLHNIGRRACSVPGLPVVTMRGSRGRVLPVARQVPVGMHPGPVILPVTIPAGGRVATGIRWVSGPVYVRSRRLDVRSVSVAIDAGQVAAPMRAVIYADRAAPATFEQPVLMRYPPAS